VTTLRVRRVLACALAGALVSGCASSVAVTTPAQVKSVPPGLTRPLRAQPGVFGGSSCLLDEVVRYLETPGGLVLAADRTTADLMLSGNLTRLEVHSNRGDKEVSVLYFAAFVVTAPIAAVMYGTKEWRADAAADGELVAADTAGALLWRKAVTVSFSEKQTTMPSAMALKTAMTAAVCQKLAATLLNGLTEHLASIRALSAAR
jgi:hypothetical protein